MFIMDHKNIQGVRWQRFFLNLALRERNIQVRLYLEDGWIIEVYDIPITLVFPIDFDGSCESDVN